MLKRNKNEVHISAATIIGDRNENQDNFRIDNNIECVDRDCFARCILEKKDRVHFVCLCDGIGSGVDGRTIATNVCKNLGQYLQEGEVLIEGNVIAKIMNAIDKVQIDIQNHLKEKNGIGGCTLVILAWIDNCYFSFSIGDSYIYHYDSK